MKTEILTNITTKQNFILKGSIETCILIPIGNKGDHKTLIKKLLEMKKTKVNNINKI